MTGEAGARAEVFLREAEGFRLGALPTEARHPLTEDLSYLAKRDAGVALRLLKQIDLGVLDVVAKSTEAIARLGAAMDETRAAGGRVFFYGCGATGRLSLSLEYLWRVTHHGDNSVHGFMSGGDLALVHSIENFEDHPEYGARQVEDAGFAEKDLFVAITEGGETPSVIGAVEAASAISRRKPWFLYCNPDDVLQEVERSRRVLENKGVEKLCLFVGPMALSGSTRLQAATAQMLAAGAALFGLGREDILRFSDFIEDTDVSFLKDFIAAEARAYAAGEYVLYETDAYGITILTDTTERAPTFSLRGFENRQDAAPALSLSYLSLPKAADAAAAWRRILLRDPEAIAWPELAAVAGEKRLSGFDFSAAAKAWREERATGKAMRRFAIDRDGGAMFFAFDGHFHRIEVRGLHPLFEHLFLKMLLNMHSTLVMGRSGRFESNVMTWVKPSNNKLVDRAIRYVEYLLQHEGVEGFSYADICRQLFAEMEKSSPAQSIVLQTVEKLRQSAAAGNQDKDSAQQRST